MATYYAISTGGNWSSSATWATSSGGAGGNGPPTSADTVNIDSTMTGTVTVDTTSDSAGSLNCTGTTGTLNFTAAKTLTVSGTVIFGSGMTITAGDADTSILIIPVGATITSNGVTFPGSLSIASSISLTGNLIILGTLFFTLSTATFSGTGNFTCTTFNNNVPTSKLVTFTFPAGKTLTIIKSLTLLGNLTMKSGTTSSAFFLNFLGNLENLTITGYAFIDVNASGSVCSIYNYAGGTLTRTTNIINVNFLNLGGLFIQ